MLRVWRSPCYIAATVALLMPRSLVAAPPPAFAQVTIPRITSSPQLEDFLEMKPSPAWEGKLAKVDHFIQRVPSDGEPVSERTEAYLGYDDKNLYAIFICFDYDPQKVRARLSRREDIFDDDTVEVMLDTFHDHRRAYAFFSNPLGVQADALWTEGQDFDFSFDTVFDTDARITPQGFVVRIAIPFRSLRFASNDPQTWGILLDRDVRRNNESSFWPRYSSRVEGRLNQEGEADGLADISPGHNFQLIPYGIFRSYRDLDLRDLDHPTFSQRDAFGQIGLDAKAVIKDKFVLDATANPDFSQIESDDPQITVNQRFEVQFPEKRPFFLENSNYFLTPIPLLFTRRIVDPQWGARLTGKDGPWAVGLLVADDASPGAEVPPDNSLYGQHAYFAVGRVSRDIGSQSSLGLMFTDREVGPYFNRVGGIDGRFKLNSNWVASFQGVVSSTLCSDTRDEVCNFGTYLAGPAAEVVLQRSGRKLNYIMDYSDRSDGFRTFTGFDPQPDIHNLYHRLEYSFRPEGKHLISWGPQMEVYHTFDHEGNYLNSGYFPALKTEFVGQTFLNIYYAKEMELLRPRDFSTLTHNQKYVRHTTEVEFKTSLYRPISFQMDYRFGSRINYDSPDNVAPFLAGRSSVTTTLTVRPSKSLRVDNTYLLFRLHNRVGSFGSMNNHIIRSKWNYQYTKKLSFRFIGHYNAVLANPAFTYLETTRNFNADFLITYLVHPSTAFYIGYNSNLENVLIPLGNDVDGDLLHGGRMRNDARGLFVKASYLVRF
ncbi:MAG TPA: DUF5916 domain-containing protein [Terriglobales bacterium]|nr:DUF5916 domain-containing protein [Terriglobales bacterium]